MADRCRCHLPLDPPDAPHWWPSRDPEPAAAVLVVARYGQDPTFLRAERVDGGWHTEGLLAIHPEHTPPRPWGRLGECWAGTEHPVVDVTTAVPQECSPRGRTGAVVEPRT